LNYYEHHLGDYAKDAGHLTMTEEGAYRRLLDAYYIREKPLPADPRECCKLARASAKPDRDAVSYVLREFFELRDDGYHQGRADAEIARFQDKQRKAARSANARWGKTDDDANADPIAPANASPDAMRTHSEGNAPRATRAATGARPSPVPNPQSPDRKDKASATAPPIDRSPEDDPPEANGHTPSPAGLICRAMRRVGLQATNPGDPRLLTLLEQGATEAEFVGIATEAVEKRKGWAWILAVLQARRAEAHDIALAPAAKADPMAWTQSRAEVVNRANALGIGPFDEVAAHNRTGPSWAQYRAQVIEASSKETA
jgi:uncharacterized protein YdaU (DUF1376 family)